MTERKDTPAASGAAPADWRPALNEARELALKHGAVENDGMQMSVELYMTPTTLAKVIAEARARTALASPQVAPALDRLISTITWDDNKQDTIEVFGTEKNLRRMKAWLDSKVATPVQVAPTATPSAVPEALYGVSNDDINWPLVWALIEAHMTAKRYHSPGTSNWGAWLYKSIVKAAREAAPAPVAPQDDARDAALWREHVAKLDALVTYCPTCCQGYFASKEMTRDEIIFECGKTVGRSTPAAKPAEEQGS